MKTKSIITVFLFLSLLGIKSEAFAQSKSEIALHRDILDSGETKKVYAAAKKNKNEVEFVFSSLFLFYKTVFSSQDMNVCTFTPSCSEYGILAVKKYGAVKGGVMTMDRLTRCNGLSPSKYEYDKKAHLLIDNP